MIISKKKWEAFKKQYQEEMTEVKKEIEYIKVRTTEMIKLSTDVLKGAN